MENKAGNIIAVGIIVLMFFACAMMYAVHQWDVDGDDISFYKDNCPDIRNREQRDQDEDGIGDICDEDRDGDGVPNIRDNCPRTPNPDQNDLDGDGVDDDQDNCSWLYNPGQENMDGDSWGDACDNYPTALNSIPGVSPRWINAPPEGSIICR